MIKLDNIQDAIDDFRQGKMVIVVDDEDRENEGDLIVAAEKITPEQVNFMLKNARGVLCAPITLSRCRELELPHQVEQNTSVLGTPFTVTVDKLEGCTTGVSAEDRCATIRALADPESTPETFGRPGHINPLYAQDAGSDRPMTFHGLRHTFASMANSARVPMYQISRAMGHSSPNTTQRIYTHLFDQTHGEVLAAVADIVKAGSAPLTSA